MVVLVTRIYLFYISMDSVRFNLLFPIDLSGCELTVTILDFNIKIYEDEVIQHIISVPFSINFEFQMSLCRIAL